MPEPKKIEPGCRGQVGHPPNMNNPLLDHIHQALKETVEECRKGFLVPYETEANNYNFINDISLIREFVELINTINKDYQINLSVEEIAHNSVIMRFTIAYN